MPHGVVLKGGTLVDGSGAPPVRADVAIDGARIAAVGANLAGEAVDCEGMVVAEGTKTISAPWRPSIRAPSGKWRS